MCATCKTNLLHSYDAIVPRRVFHKATLKLLSVRTLHTNFDVIQEEMYSVVRVELIANGNRLVVRSGDCLATCNMLRWNFESILIQDVHVRCERFDVSVSQSNGHRNEMQSCLCLSKHHVMRIHEGASKRFRTGRLERELQMVPLSATRCSCIAI
jgi:hypothetical protein